MILNLSGPRFPKMNIIFTNKVTDESILKEFKVIHKIPSIILLLFLLTFLTYILQRTGSMQVQFIVSFS